MDRFAIMLKAIPRAVAHGLMAIGLCACGSMPMPEALKPSPPTPERQATSLEGRIGELPAQSLGRGKCSTFLWSRNIDRKLVFYTATDESYARMFVDGRVQDLPRASGSGDSVLGQSARQRYVWRDLTVDADMTLERRPGLARGAIIPQGTLTLINREGWEYVLPVAGLIACGE